MQFAAFGCFKEDKLIAFAEASVRHHVIGIESSPVGFLEGIYVDPQQRKNGIAERLISEVERWSKSRGCLVLGSDTDIENRESQAFHDALGFVARERVIIYERAMTSSVELPAASAAATSVSPVNASASVDGGSTSSGLGWVVIHVVVALVGIYSLFSSNIRSPNPLEGAVYPLIAALSVIYAIGWFLSWNYRRKTDARRRREDLFTSDSKGPSCGD